MQKTVLVTPSYAPDFERCRILCDSVRQHVGGHAEHVIIVDHQDEALFSQLAGDGTRLLIKQDMLPGWLYQLPFARKWWLNLCGLPVRGWILQQIVKLSVGEAIDADLYLFADSDVAFVRPFDVGSLVDAAGRVRLYGGARKPQDIADPRHQAWYRHAGKVFDLTGPDYQQRDYVSQLVAWRRDTLVRLTQRIGEHGRRNWQAVLANTLDFSEYTLYGVFAEHVLGEDCGHLLVDTELCDCSWHHAINTQADLKRFIEQVPPSFPAVLIQSNLGIAPADYAQVLQDRSAVGS
ncbi:MULTISPECIES: DUF6492 family protein [Thiorhodovibrio]|uniref:DUF6492 family protein n=1 Tax=Thiorhodovibrio TaxID=61593 RepID=UPI0019129C85|nr:MULTISPECIES: DUF6492 family protein [Thiorhodovibrio]MBK5969442.1 hypothetical protein [Thiorhodovibrio winogradskyi]WPL11014.1 hypothetical protein Thiosp_00738 [Thiorhodovibrio litoralis]